MQSTSMANRAERPKASRSQLFLGFFSGLVPYLGGGLLATLTWHARWLAFVGVVICVFSTSTAYVLRKSRDPIQARQRLIIDPFLYGLGFVLSAVVIGYLFIRH
jgi:Na+-transporting NADH:ubiquinone oxidoreductase subunit NqrB